MDAPFQFVLFVLLSSSVIAALVSGIVTAVMQKRNEKESRLFNAKLDAYKEFAAHLESRFVSLTKKGKNLDIATLTEISAKCLLISSPTLNRELKTFLTYVSDIYKKLSAPGYAKEKEDDDFEKLWQDADRIEDLMRQDLGF